MNAKIRRKLKARKRRIQKRLDKRNMGRECPVISASNIDYELAERTQAISAGGIGLIHKMVCQLALDRMINETVNLFKIYLPYAESDHVLNMAYNLLAGGCASPPTLCNSFGWGESHFEPPDRTTRSR